MHSSILIGKIGAKMEDAAMTVLSDFISAGAACIAACAAIWYARATHSLANATSESVNAQRIASDALIQQNHDLADSNRVVAWTDSVRDAVAELLSLDAEIKDDQAGSLGREFVDNLIQRRLMIRYRIDFRLEREKPLHQQLLAALDKLIAEEAHSANTVAQVRGLTIDVIKSKEQPDRRQP